eukprot:TRINITY_DN1440_c0_g1_i2.p1 TRINITY_DN1440_c0_g1~~TRINITY_DN1440_c0_g1_i2.p1  ORF type:complete len:325 (-),score=44.67 TRINITY_DN1440_c0_g1_i2:360-1289(-)
MTKWACRTAKAVLLRVMLLPSAAHAFVCPGITYRADLSRCAAGHAKAYVMSQSRGSLLNHSSAAAAGVAANSTFGGAVNFTFEGVANTTTDGGRVRSAAAPDGTSEIDGQQVLTNLALLAQLALPFVLKQRQTPLNVTQNEDPSTDLSKSNARAPADVTGTMPPRADATPPDPADARAAAAAATLRSRGFALSDTKYKDKPFALKGPGLFPDERVSMAFGELKGIFLGKGDHKKAIEVDVLVERGKDVVAFKVQMQQDIYVSNVMPVKAPAPPARGSYPAAGTKAFTERIILGKDSRRGTQLEPKGSGR